MSDMDILDLLYERMWQAQGRAIEIRNYVKRKGEVISKNDFTLKSIPKYQAIVEESYLAIKAIEEYRKKLKKITPPGDE